MVKFTLSLPLPLPLSPPLSAVDSVINHISVPPVIQAGKEVTIYATFAAKPLPPTFPSLIVDVINEPSVPTIVTSMQIVPSPTNDTEYIILHTFVVPLDFNKTTKIRPRFSTPPDGWRSLVELTFEPIGVVFPGEINIACHVCSNTYS